MIKYNLKCNNKHEFESWFLDSKEYEKLSKKKLLECIYCQSKKIEKSIMSPGVINIKKIVEKNQVHQKEFLQVKNDLNKLRKFVEKNFEFAGDQFVKKIRSAYYDKNNKKSYYGTTTPEERDELKEEGIDLLTIPWIDKDN